MNLKINDWQLSVSENTLAKRDDVVKLQPLCTRLLHHLAQHAGHIVSRVQLLHQVWQGRVVSEDAINNCVRKLRKAMNDDSREPVHIQTVPGKGYQLIANVTEIKARNWIQYRWYAVAATFVFASVGLLASNIKIDVITIEPDMSAADKEWAYEQIRDKTAHGGHIIRMKMRSL